MKLILTEYINSLKEDGELDKLIKDVLLAHNFEIFSEPERGRQYGVDIYAVGKDFQDNDVQKVFLITVKQGDIDRQKWNVDQNSVQQSLDEIRTVFIRNNLAPQHVNLPKKIIVVSNGRMKQAIQQNWRGYQETNNDYEYVYWGIDFIVNEFQAHLLNEDSFSNEVRSLFRKTIINLENPEYRLEDFTALLTSLFSEFQATKQKRKKFKLLKQLRLVVAIVTKYCREVDNLKHAIKCVEKYILLLWSEISKNDTDKDLIIAFIEAYNDQISVFYAYYAKLSYIGSIQDGFGKAKHEALIYTAVLYEQVGIFSLYGALLLQIHDVLLSKNEKLAGIIKQRANEVADMIIKTLNNNPIFFNPRADDHHIELNILLILLYRLDRKNDIKGILQIFLKQISEGLAFLKIFPVFSNSTQIMAELDVDHEKRIKYEYGSSTLLISLIEWTLVIADNDLYNSYRLTKSTLMKDIELILWFPDKSSESGLYHQNVVGETGYSLSEIELLEDFNAYKTLVLEEYAKNCAEKDFSFIQKSFWSIGLIAARHYRTYIFPHYWRQFISG
ncbi:MAG TPA: hypothetical protein VNQ80_06710 [Parapedobacter sp.]|uniref:hypothetical protein n=1 Tax=Parapedobacter sp. TaxID=1958893 RepID=UPI002BFF31E4|nr:hypothetical protein [Parapedobacter sp.]HWK57007.1 hypothetical protein [Parapedobacter sp.]